MSFRFKASCVSFRSVGAWVVSALLAVLVGCSGSAPTSFGSSRHADAVDELKRRIEAAGPFDTDFTYVHRELTGGVAKVMRETAAVLVRRGFRVKIIAAALPKEPVPGVQYVAVPEMAKQPSDAEMRAFVMAQAEYRRHFRPGGPGGAPPSPPAVPSALRERLESTWVRVLSGSAIVRDFNPKLIQYATPEQVTRSEVEASLLASGKIGAVIKDTHDPADWVERRDFIGRLFGVEESDADYRTAIGSIDSAWRDRILERGAQGDIDVFYVSEELAHENAVTKPLLAAPLRSRVALASVTPYQAGRLAEQLGLPEEEVDRIAVMPSGGVYVPTFRYEDGRLRSSSFAPGVTPEDPHPIEADADTADEAVDAEAGDIAAPILVADPTATLQRLGLIDAPLVFGFWSQMLTRKQLPLTVEWFAAIVEHARAAGYDTARWRLWFSGRYDEANDAQMLARAQLKAAIDASGLSDQIVVLSDHFGVDPPEDLKDNMILRTNVLLHTSRSEGYGIVPGEAVAAGVVPIVLDAPNIGDVARRLPGSVVIEGGTSASEVAKIVLREVILKYFPKQGDRLGRSSEFDAFQARATERTPSLSWEGIVTELFLPVAVRLLPPVPSGAPTQGQTDGPDC